MTTREKIISCKTITEFQKRVYLELLEVPAGHTISYGELARRIGCGSPQAAHRQSVRRCAGIRSRLRFPATASSGQTVQSEVTSDRHLLR